MKPSCLPWLALAAATGGLRSSLWWMGTLAGPGAVQGLIAVAQRSGLDPYAWDAVDLVVGTHGNPNFVSASCALAAPGALALALWPGPAKRRAASLGAVGLAVAGVAVTGDYQGWLAGLAGAAVVGVAWKRAHRPSRADGRRLLAVMAAVLVVVVVSVVLVQRSQARSLVERRYQWGTAVDVIAEHPLTGLGPGGFAERWTSLRPERAAAARPLRVSDDPQSVPLAMGVRGGLLLLTAWAAVVSVTTWRAGRALWHPSGVLRPSAHQSLAPAMVVAGLAGADVAYLAQAAVSVDVPGLAVVHWVGLGALWAVTGVPDVDLSQRRPVATRLVALPLAVAALAGVVPAVQSLRAEARLLDGLRAAAAGELLTAVDRVGDAAALRPDDPRYPLVLAALNTQRGDPQATTDAAERVRELAPHLAKPAAHASQAWLAAGDLGEAATWLDQWLETDPHNPVALGRAAEAAARLGQDVRARALVDQALEPPPGSGEGWLAVGDAAAALGDHDLASGAYAAALASDSFDSPAAQLRVAEAAGDANALFP